MYWEEARKSDINIILLFLIEFCYTVPTGLWYLGAKSHFWL